jgi:hypothetical protein
MRTTAASAPIRTTNPARLTNPLIAVEILIH